MASLDPRMPVFDLIAEPMGVFKVSKADCLMPVLGRDPSLAAALLARDHCRGRDDATVAVLRRKD
jgi:hypothetical protein